jgi:hypothetical protein
MSSSHPRTRQPKRQFLITGPAHCASYLVNSDSSGLSPEERAQADAWLRRECVRILDIARDARGEPAAPRFTFSYWLHAPETGAHAGTVIEYMAEMLPPPGHGSSHLFRAVPRVFRALRRPRIPSRHCAEILMLARHPAPYGFPNPAARRLAGAILGAAIRNRHRTRAWEAPPAARTPR